MTVSQASRHFVIALTAAAVLCLTPEVALAGPQKAVRKAPVLKRVTRSIKRGWHRIKVRRAENKAFKKLIRSNKQVKAIYKAEKKQRGTGRLRASKWFNLTMGTVNGGMAGVLLATGNPFGVLNFGVGVWSNSIGLESGRELKHAVRGARRATLKAAMDQGVKLDSTLTKAYRRDRIAGRMGSSDKATSSTNKPSTSLSTMGAGLKTPGVSASKANRLGLSSGDLQKLRTKGVEYSPKRDQFRLRNSGKYGKNASQWHDLGQQLLSKDGQFRYHRPRNVNGGRLPAFVEKLGN